MTTILQDKWKEIAEKELVNGQGDLEKGLCVMQAVDYISSGGMSDHPECACPVLTNYAIALNDRLNNEDRQKLKPLIPLLVGTRAKEESRETTQIARKRFMMWRNVTVTYPLLLDLFKADDHAKVLREFPNTVEGMNAAAAYLKENREAIRKLANANANANANAYAYAYAYAYANAYANANAYADANANAYADAYAYAYANAYANANAYADANANAYAYANAKKIRSAIADSAVETLRMAIGVT